MSAELSLRTTTGSSMMRFPSARVPCTHLSSDTFFEKCLRRKSAMFGPRRRTTAIAAEPGGVSSIARLESSRSMLDVMFRIRQRDAVKREVRGNSVDEFPIFEKFLRIAAGCDDVGPIA